MSRADLTLCKILSNDKETSFVLFKTVPEKPSFLIGNTDIVKSSFEV